MLPAELLHALHLRNAAPVKGEARKALIERREATAAETKASWRFTHPEGGDAKKDA